jgi:hypothetical protein
MMAMPPGATHPPSWLHYVVVESVDSSAPAVLAHGGKLWVQPADIPGVGRFAVASDPQGAMFALYQPLQR